MSPVKTQSRRSVSPFGLTEEPVSRWFELSAAIKLHIPEKPAQEYNKRIKSFEDLYYLPKLLDQIANAPAFDAPLLPVLCDDLVKLGPYLIEKGLFPFVFSSMERLFEIKTETFLLTRSIEADEDENKVEQEQKALFSQERDTLIGRFFWPITDSSPGLFSEFINKWVSTEEIDRQLHFLDFCLGSKNPTFEYFLLFDSPVLNRVLRNKSQMKKIAASLNVINKQPAVSVWCAKVKQFLDL